jgi:hypothetical protein
VYVTYSSGSGLKHLTWVPAERVRRLTDQVTGGAAT